jgi:hypothetical protein
MARILITIALIAALALVVFSWFGASSRVPEIAVGIPSRATASQAGSDPSDSLDVEFKTRVESVEVSARTPELVNSSASASAQDLRVRVVDPAGEPVADVPSRLSAGREMKSVSKQAALQALQTTDAEGYVQFPDVRPILSASQDAAPDEQWSLVHEILFENPPGFRLDRSKLELPFVVSTIPFSGAVDVHVRDLDGKDAKDGSRVELRLLRDEDLASPVTPNDRPICFAETHGGLARFPCVELGRTWEAFASRPDSSIRTRVRAAGPLKPRTQALIEVVLGTDHPVIAYRAVDERHQALPKTALQITRSNQGLFGFEETTRTETDANGRFSVEIQGTHGFAGDERLIVARPDTDPPVGGRAAVPKNLANGSNEGGDVVLARFSVIAAGIVQDEAGAPMPDARVSMTAGQRRRFSIDGGEASDASVSSAPDGKFEFRALFASDQIDVWADKNGMRSNKTRVEDPASPVVLTLSRYCTISGRVLLDPGIEPHRIALDFVDPQHREVGVKVRKRSGDGSFELAPIPAGLYDLAWSYESVRLAERANVDVSKDTDLGDIDLRGKLSMSEIALVGAPDPSKLRGEFAWRPAGSQENWHNGNFSGDTIKVVSAQSPIDVWVRPFEYRCEAALGVSGRREIRLSAPLRVRLELRTSARLPKYPYLLRATMEQEGLRVGWCERDLPFTDDQRSVVYDVVVPGRMRVGWSLEHKLDNGAIGGGVLHDKQTEIEVLDVPGEQAFTIDVDAEALTGLMIMPPF